MLRIAPSLRDPGGLPRGGEFIFFGVAMVSGYLNFLVLVWFILNGMAPVSASHMMVNAIATPLLFLAALVWVQLRLMDWVTPETGVGFGLAGYALGARATCEFLVWLGEPCVRNAVGHDVPSPFLADLVRYTGAWAYVFGLAVVVASSWQAILAARRKRANRARARPQGHGPGAARWVVASTLLLVVGLLSYLVLAGAVRLLDHAH